MFDPKLATRIVPVFLNRPEPQLGGRLLLFTDDLH